MSHLLAARAAKFRDWIILSGCSHVAMESTGIYWIALYGVLEAAPEGLTLLVVNASFIPEKPIRELWHLTRCRKSIVHDITSQKNRIEKFLQSSGLRLSSFVSDIFGVTGRGIILHLIKYGH